VAGRLSSLGEVPHPLILCKLGIGHDLLRLRSRSSTITSATRSERGLILV
jgi:hypothetical protein